MSEAAKPWRDEEVVRELYHEQHMTQPEIAEELGCSRKTIYRWMDKHGVETRDGPQMNEFCRPFRDPDYLREQYHENGMNLYDLAEKHDCDAQNVLYWMRKHDIDTDSKSVAFADGDMGPLMDKDWLREQYCDSNRSCQNIASELSVSEAAVQQWLERHGIERREPWEHLTDGDLKRLSDREWLKEQYIDEYRSGAEIAEQLGLSQCTVSKHLREQDIETREPGYPSGRLHWMWKDESHHTDYFGPNWEEQRQKARIRDQARCRRCGLTEPEHIEKYSRLPHVHHIKPRSEYFDGGGLDWKEANRLENLVTLCQRCHMKIEHQPFRFDWR